MPDSLLPTATDAQLEEARDEVEVAVRGANADGFYDADGYNDTMRVGSLRLAAECIEIVRELRQSGAAQRAFFVVAREERGHRAADADISADLLAADAALLRRLLPEGESE